MGIEQVAYDPARRQGQVEAELDRLASQITTTEELVSQLEGRLTGVLRTDPAPGSDVGVPEEVKVPLADMLAVLRKRVRFVSDQVASIIDRIEL